MKVHGILMKVFGGGEGIVGVWLGEGAGYRCMGEKRWKGTARAWQ